ncbi:Protein-L-isoaspartate O-methyltransferase [Pontiella desulfatans]|uniref:Protein-L-isoaspartate O-methyltransferase n=1 Tax=Pontiella desulfatans TaxID=2750659 RepID=A0A6C2U2L3_PONDE|nr:protein-L-isoaspartate(D-aspartate) O-methyltransferase [Pontiella desulfatans]VGO14220.1 Protein-L-isoaspartate O-methyltransferase [Pontiella desulfatans]
MEAERKAMVAVVKAHGVQDDRVLAAMGKVRRHVYIPEAHRGRDSYGDHPCPIGHGQTISQPFIVAYMTQRIGVKPGMRILEIGTGSGYQAAVLAELEAEVFSIEIVPALADHARGVLAAEGYSTVKVKTGDGYKGWPEHAPFDAIIVTCAPADIPKKLVEQLKDGGRMILPVGTGIQQLVILEKAGDSFKEIPDLHVRFVPMVKGSEE